MEDRTKFRRPGHTPKATFSRRVARAPETARFLRRAAPAFLKELSKEYKRETISSPKIPRPDLWPEHGLHAAWLGHSTVLLKVDGFTILTDPVFSLRVGLNFGPVTLGIKRLVDAAAEIPDLPPIDLVLLSHAHMDHFDLPSLRHLENPRTQVVTAHRTSDLLRVKHYAQVHELRWAEGVRVGPVEVKAFQVAHWGARMRSDVYRGFNGYLLNIGRRQILFGGDTAYTTHFKSLRSSRPIDLAIMPIGAYDPWIHVHCNPEQAMAMANEAGAEYILPVHHQTFQLSREPRLEPLERLLTAAGTAPERICLQEIGAEFTL
ncbi:MAG: MBL fold metallo-hydrolase [Acidobacteriota bacterium]|nr:MBL fold metallo-hydrolase [Acidobacteriota bacterium]